MSPRVIQFLKKDLFSFFIVALSSVIYVIGLVWFLTPTGIYAGGLTGLAQLVSELFALANINMNLGLLIFILNVPVVLIGFRFVSKRFAIYSIISVVIQSILTSGIFPFVDFVINNVENPNFLVCAIIGAIITGLGAGLSLRYGTSTGGIDILAQAATLRGSKISIGTITLISNIIIGCIGGGLIQGKPDIIIYTFIRIVLCSITVDKVHTAYSYVSLNIISNKSTEITDVILKETLRGCTIINAEGAYSKNKKFDIFMVISSYEIQTTIDIIKRIDPDVFIVVSPVKRIEGNYLHKTII